MISRRSFLWLTGAAAGLPAAHLSAQRARGGQSSAGPLPPSIASLASMRGRAKPITADERRARIERAKSIMAAQKIDAIVLTGGTSLVYFTGIRWGGSERPVALVVPKEGNPFVVCPRVGEGRAREPRAVAP